jgi:hypothetical protein
VASLCNLKSAFAGKVIVVKNKIASKQRQRGTNAMHVALAHFQSSPGISKLA